MRHVFGTSVLWSPLVVVVMPRRHRLAGTRSVFVVAIHGGSRVPLLLVCPASHGLVECLFCHVSRHGLFNDGVSSDGDSHHGDSRHGLFKDGNVQGGHPWFS